MSSSTLKTLFAKEDAADMYDLLFTDETVYIVDTATVDTSFHMDVTFAVGAKAGSVELCKARRPAHEGSRAKVPWLILAPSGCVARDDVIASPDMMSLIFMSADPFENGLAVPAPGVARPGVDLTFVRTYVSHHVWLRRTATVCKLWSQAVRDELARAEKAAVPGSGLCELNLLFQLTDKHRVWMAKEEAARRKAWAKKEAERRGQHDSRWAKAEEEPMLKALQTLSSSPRAGPIRRARQKRAMRRATATGASCGTNATGIMALTCDPSTTPSFDFGKAFLGAGAPVVPRG